MRVLAGQQRCLQRPVSAATPRHAKPCLVAPLQQRSLHHERLANTKITRSRQAVIVRASTLFEGLNKSLTKAWDAVRKDGKLTADNIKEPMKMIRRALLEADVSLPVVRRFVKRVEEDALGVAVIRGVNPEQQLVQVVYQELAKLMGGSQAVLEVPDDGPQV